MSYIQNRWEKYSQDELAVMMLPESIKFALPKVLNSKKCGRKSKIESLFFSVIKELKRC